MTNISITPDVASRIAALIAPPHGSLWASMTAQLADAPLRDVVSELWRLDDGTDPDLHATAVAASIVMRQLTPPAARGLSEVAQVIGEIGVVAGAVRWTAAAISERIQHVRDRRRQERDGAVERTDLIELY